MISIQDIIMISIKNIISNLNLCRISSIIHVVTQYFQLSLHLYTLFVSLKFRRIYIIF